MEYTISQLALLAGISTRTLRHYDKISLLSPAYINQSGYRIYTRTQVDTLQEILFFKALDMPLADIRKTIYQPDYDRAAALEKHLLLLEKKQQHLSLLIDNIQKTISSLKGGKTMTDKEKFEGLKQELISHNELQYGKEVRSKYGENTVDAANAHLLNLSEEQFENMEETGNKIISSLEYSVKNNLSADSAAAKEIAQLHKHWLSFTWPSYSKEAHLSLVEMYVSDERFTVYYDKNIKGCALFLKNAVQAFIDNI